MTEIGEVPKMPESYSWQIEGKNGEPFIVHYIKSPIDIEDIEDPTLEDEILPQIEEVAQQAFPHWSETGLEQFLDWLYTTNTFSYTTDKEGKVVGFSVFELDKLEENNNAKAMYTSYIGVSPDLEGNSLYERSLKPIIELEKPDIVTGCTGNPAVYVANRKCAEEKGYSFYPTGSSVPDAILELGRSVLANFTSESNAQKLGDNLIKQNRGITARGKNPYPYFDQFLKLAPNQQVMYMQVRNGFEINN